MKDDVSRRGLLGLLGSAATLVRSPGEAIAKHALGVASAGVAGTDGDVSCSSAPRPFGPMSPIEWARCELSDKAWNEPRNIEYVRPSIACLKSASPVTRERFERIERAKEAQTRELARIALDLLNDGKITL